MKAQHQMASLVNSIKHLKKKQCQFFKKFEEEETVRNPFHEASILLIPKPEKTPQEKKTLPDEYKCRYPQRNTSKPNEQHIERVIYNDQVGFFFPGYKNCST